MISKNEAIDYARRHIAGWDFVDVNTVEEPIFFSRASALERGVKDSPAVRDAWLVGFARIPSGHSLDDEFTKLIVDVDAETGETSVLESL